LETDLKIVYPHGAGGAWLRHVITCAITDRPWENCEVNFHETISSSVMQRILPGHTFDNYNNSHISISDDSCKYNFWILYVVKRLFYELDYTRHNGSRILLCDVDQINLYKMKTLKDHFFWTLNQCRYMQEFKWYGQFEVCWKDLFVNPQKAWNNICCFLEENRQRNYWSYQKFLLALDNYKLTCSRVRPKINLKQKHFLIWSLAYLQNSKISAPFDVFENFGTPIMLDWINEHQEKIISHTKKSLFEIDNV
jgi:hypothetical protein